MSLILKNLILFKTGWLACVLGAANGIAWLGAVVVGGIALEHLRTARAPRRETTLLGIAAVIGLAWESALVTLGFLEYRAGNIAPGLAPYWIVAMWVLFATTLNVGMKWLKKHWVVAAVAGGICGPLAFFAGERAGAVEFSQSYGSLLAIGVGWALLLPVMARFAHRFDGHAELLPIQTARD